MVDADARLVVAIIEQVARKFGLGLTLYCDTNHVLTSDYAVVKVIGAGVDAVDLALMNDCRAGEFEALLARIEDGEKEMMNSYFSKWHFNVKEL